MDLIFNIKEQIHKNKLLGKITSTNDYAKMKLSLLEILISFWTGNPKKPTIPYVIIKNDVSFQRAIIVCQDKIFSFSFSYHLHVNNKDYDKRSNNIIEYYYKGFRIGTKAISEARALINSYNAVENNTYCYTILDVDESTSEEAFVLFESLYMIEPGYIRYDHDPNRADPIAHPLDHLDINFSKDVVYKIGLSNRIGISGIEQILSAIPQCPYLNF